MLLAGLETEKSQKGGKSELKRRKFCYPSRPNKGVYFIKCNQKSPLESKKNHIFDQTYISYKTFQRASKR